MNTPPDFSAVPSKARAPLALRLGLFIVLLGIAIAAIWWIDRGANFTNTHP